KTPSGVAAARGTFYAVAVEDGKGFVQVKEGKVAVTPANKAGEEANPGTVSKLTGKLTMIPEGGGAEQELKIGDSVSVGSTLKTGPDSTAIIRLSKDSAINMVENTETIIEVVEESDTTPKVHLDLKSGTMSALIKPVAKGKMDFRIKTPSGVAAARGTFYSVAVEDGRGYVNVKDGEVKVIPLDEIDADPDQADPAGGAN
ncbi:MAG: FecR family protein, partial [Verrucomicrobiota bacterium]